MCNYNWEIRLKIVEIISDFLPQLFQYGMNIYQILACSFCSDIKSTKWEFVHCCWEMSSPLLTRLVASTGLKLTSSYSLCLISLPASSLHPNTTTNHYSMLGSLRDSRRSVRLTWVGTSWSLPEQHWASSLGPVRTLCHLGLHAMRAHAASLLLLGRECLRIFYHQQSGQERLLPLTAHQGPM